jgi:hypothetical protein
LRLDAGFAHALPAFTRARAFREPVRDFLLRLPRRTHPRAPPGIAHALAVLTQIQPFCEPVRDFLPRRLRRPHPRAPPGIAHALAVLTPIQPFCEPVRDFSRSNKTPASDFSGASVLRYWLFAKICA